jgi:hypothetical protein
LKNIVVFALFAFACCFQMDLVMASSPEEDTSLKSKKGSFYFFWGYNRSSFSPSDIHFKGPEYDFTLYGLKASDRPSAFGTVYFNPIQMSIPQYNYRIGYYLTNRFCLSVGMDHMKYVVNANQTALLSGVISPVASPKYAGSYINHPVSLEKDLLTFDHTNGFNFLSLDAEYLQPLFSVRNEMFSLYWNAGLGGVFLITKTDVRVFNDGLDNRFHLSGYAFAYKTGPRLEYKHKVFIAAEFKSGFVSLPDVLIKNDAPERAEHSVYFYEYYIVAGLNFKIHCGKEKVVPGK